MINIEYNFSKKIKLCFIISIVVLLNSGISAIEFTEHQLSDAHNSSWSVFNIDIDLDNDIDIISSARFGNCIKVWLNENDHEFIEISISNTAVGAMGLQAADIDNDDDIDIVCACDIGNGVSWWENIGNYEFIEHEICDWQGPTFVYLEYVNDDDLIDILVAACESASNKMGWFENNESQDFTEHIVKDNWDHANSVYAEDIDLDGDTDILGTASWAGEMSWFENDGNENFTEHNLLTNYGRPSCVIAGDLDQDQDVDIITTVCQMGEILWFENDGTMNFTQNQIGVANAPHSVIISDMDEDSDLDVVIAAILGAEISWFENDGEEEFDKNIITNSATGVTDVSVADIDGDGDQDISASIRDANRLSWYENRYYSVDFSAEPLTGNVPLQVQFEDISNLIAPAEMWLWDFENDDMFDNAQQDPLWTYNEPGVYSVLFISGEMNNFQSMLKENYIRVFDGHTALGFQDDDAFVACSAEQFPDLSGAFTLEAWINPTDYGPFSFLGLGHVFDKNALSVNLVNVYPGLPEQSLSVNMIHTDEYQSSASSSANSIALNIWQHIAICYDGISDLDIYINGVEDLFSEFTPPVGDLSDNSDWDLLFGNDQDNTGSFKGVIDEIRIWDHVRSQTEIQNNMYYYLTASENGLEAYWQINEGTGSVITDIISGYQGEIDSAFWTQGLELLPVSSEEELLVVTTIELLVSPNPFNPETVISFQLSAVNYVELIIYNIKGQKVRTLIQDQLSSGEYSFKWQGKDEIGYPVTSGVYFCELSLGKDRFFKKLVLLK